MARGQTPAGFTVLVFGILLLAVALSLVSVHVRLLNAGLGCPDWPECYGRLGQVVEPGGSGDPAVAAPSRAAPQWATLAHRLLAGALGLLIPALAAMALLQRGHPPGRKRLALLITAVMVTLAVLGIWSAGLRVPAVVMANFAGGILLVALLWRLLFGVLPPPEPPGPATGAVLRRWVRAGTALLALQLLLGGLVTAFFAGNACASSPTCGGAWPRLPLAEIAALFRPLELDAGGRVVMADSLAGLLTTHRLLGFALLPVLAVCATLAWRAGRRGTAGVFLIIVISTVALGVVTIHLELPPGLVLAHYAASLALLMILLWLGHVAAEGRGTRAPVARALKPG
jgi:heme a synthase